ncbi:MAG TPA: hypothetical protein VJU87_00455 [Gemmatimonadaceae bacterium]|nr:hypothetical protein [Gemmatimonadaceae bacterium]
MRLPTLTWTTLVAALAITPAVLRAQIATSTVCNDGTIARTGGAAACTAHRGVDERRTASVRSVERTRSSANAGKPGVSTALPAPRPRSTTGSADTRTSTRLPLPRTGAHPSRPREGLPRIPERDDSRVRTGARLCKDGTVVYGKGKDGNCGGHGGVDPHGVAASRAQSAHRHLESRPDRRSSGARGERSGAEGREAHARDRATEHDRDRDRDAGRDHGKKEHDREHGRGRGRQR